MKRKLVKESVNIKRKTDELIDKIEEIKERK